MYCTKHSGICPCYLETGEAWWGVGRGRRGWGTGWGLYKASLYSSTFIIYTDILGLGLTTCLWLGPPWFNYWFSFTLAYNRISHEYSSLFIIVINLIFMFSLDALTEFELGAFMRTEFVCSSVSRVASGPRVKMASCKSALTPSTPSPGGLLYWPF